MQLPLQCLLFDTGMGTGYFVKSLPYTINSSCRKKGMEKTHKNSHTIMYELFLFFSYSSGLF